MSVACETVPDRSLSLARSIPAMLETGLIVFLLFLFTEGLLGPLLVDETSPEESIILRMMWLPAYGVIVGLSAFRFGALAGLILRMPLIVLMMGLIAASIFWSIDQEVTFRRSIAIGFSTLFGLYLVARYNWRDMLALFGIVWLVCGIGSVVMALGVPSLGVDQEVHVGAWRGLWFQKNDLGGHMSRASFLFAFLAITQAHLRKIWVFGIFLAAALVLLSTSKTALLSMLVGFVVLGCGAFMRRGPISAVSLSWAGVTFGGALLIFIVTQPALALELIGRDPTLTGRTDIWIALGDMIAERPWRGYGYGAFWGEGSVPAEYVRKITQWEVPTAHNGWIETWLSIGLGGLLLFALNFLMTLGRGIGAAFKSWNGFFALGFVVQFLIASLSESIILQQNSITWLSYVAVSGALLWQERAPREPAALRLGRRKGFLLPN